MERFDIQDRKFEALFISSEDGILMGFKLKSRRAELKKNVKP